MEIAVIGAGISGLSVSQLLSERHNVSVFEKESRPGGLIKCEDVDGSLFHTCGGHVFNSKRQDVLDWFWGVFHQDAEFTKAERYSVVFLDNGLEVPYPIENHMYMLDIETQNRFISDLLGIAKGGYSEPHNFEEFLKGRFGNTLYSLYFQPYNEKVWRRDLGNVPLSWLEGKLPMPTIHEMIFNNMNHVKEKSFVHSTFWYEKANGSQYIADKLAEGLRIQYNSDVASVETDGIKWTVMGKDFDVVIFCGNIKDMIKMIKGVDISDFYEPIISLESHGTTAVFCEIDKNPYSWIYLPSKEHESHRVICTGNFSTSNNSKSLPNDRITATIEFTDEIDKDEILDNLLRMPLHPRYITHKYNRFSYPIQDENTRDLIKVLKKKLATYNFFFTGRFADWEYYNMDVAIGAAMDLCKTL